jgi:hypothetical protein
VAHFCGPGIKGTFEAGPKTAVIFAEKSGAGHEQGGLEKPADELRLARGSGFRKDVVCVAPRRRLGDFEFCGGGGKPPAADNFVKNPLFGKGQPEFCGKLFDSGVKSRGGIDDKDGGGRPVDVENRSRPARGERDDMGKKRRAIFAACKLDRAAGFAFAKF